MKVLTNKEIKFMAITNDILDQLIGNAKTQDDLFGKNGIIKELSKRLMERMLEGGSGDIFGEKFHSVK